MSAPESWLTIAEITGGLADGKLLQVVSLIDLLGEGERPRAVLDAMRPRLARLKPSRRLTLQRVLLMPIEDLLEPPERYRPHSGRLSRRVIRPCSTLVTEGVDPAILENLRQRAGAVRGDDRRGAIAVGAGLWKAAAAAIWRSLERLARDRTFAEQTLAGLEADGLEQLQRCAELLDIGEQVESIKCQLPARPIAALTESHFESLRQAIEQLAPRGDGPVQTFLALMATRLVRPGALLALLNRFGHGAWAGSLGQEVAVQVCGHLVTRTITLPDLLRSENGLARASESAFQLAEALASVAEAAVHASSLASSPLVTDGIRRGRAVIARFILERALPATTQALLAVSAPQTAATAAELWQRLEQAEDLAWALHNCARAAEGVGVGPQVAAALEHLVTSLAEPLDSLTGSSPEQIREACAIARLIELIRGPEEAEKLLTRTIFHIYGANAGTSTDYPAATY